MRIHPGGNLGRVESDELADLAERDPTLGDKSADEPGRHAQPVCDLIDVQQPQVRHRRAIRCVGHVGVKAIDGHEGDNGDGKEAVPLQNAPSRFRPCADRESPSELGLLGSKPGVAGNRPEWRVGVRSIDETVLGTPAFDVSHDRSETIEVKPGQLAGVCLGFDVVHEPVGPSAHNKSDVFLTVLVVAVDKVSEDDLGRSRADRSCNVVPFRRVESFGARPDHPS